MPSSYTSNLGIELPADGELDGVWGDVVNDNMNIFDRAINGTISLTLSGTSSTLTTSDGTLSDGQYKLLVLAGSPSGTHTITIAPNDAQKIYFVRNTTAQSVVFTQGSGGNVTIATGDSGVIYADGAGAGAAVANLTDHFAMSSVKITGGSITGITDLAVADGGTGASDAPTARTNLGLGSIATQAANSVAITGGSINSTTIGATTPSTIAGTTGSFSGDLSIADKIVHTGDTDTAIRFPSANTVTVETGGVERMRLTSNQVTFPISTGNLGVEVGSGRTGDGAAFIDLIGDTTYTDFGLRVSRESGGANTVSRLSHRGTGGFEIIAQDAAPLRLYTTNLERMRIDSAGNVGIGNTSPTATLTVDGTVGGTIIASQAEAEAGTDTTKLMTPERTAQAIPAKLNAAGSAPIYACRAWVNFNGTGAVAIRASGNVTSITDNGSGDYTVNFTTAMPDANYAVVATAENTKGAGASASFACLDAGTAQLTTAVRILIKEGSNSGANDRAFVNVAVFR